jgi:ABC-type bacteriocin/lantibiotic exporter with double-glycine peptidase domain
VAFYLCAPLAAVLIATIPVIGFAGSLLINAVTAAQKQSLEQYAAAGGVATEALGAIRTVTALNAQPDIINTYKRLLINAMNVLPPHSSSFLCPVDYIMRTLDWDYQRF